MVDLYKILGVPEDASPAEIKAAYRQKAFSLHPDTNPEGQGQVARARFHEVQEAYGVLRDEGKRAQYDAMRQAGFGGGVGDFEDAAAGRGGGSGGGFGTPWGQPSMGGPDFDAAFEAWWKKMTEEFHDYEDREFAKERMNAERMARAAAWEWEKQEAQANKLRSQRLKWRTEDARLQRHATTLRRFWQTHSGLTMGDALVAALVLAGTAGIALAWKSHIAEARQEGRQAQGQGEQAQQQQAEQPQPQQAAAEAPTAAAMAAAAAHAAGAATQS